MARGVTAALLFTSIALPAALSGAATSASPAYAGPSGSAVPSASAPATPSVPPTADPTGQASADPIPSDTSPPVPSASTDPAPQQTGKPATKAPAATAPTHRQTHPATSSPDRHKQTQVAPAPKPTTTPSPRATSDSLGAAGSASASATPDASASPSATAAAPASASDQHVNIYPQDTGFHPFAFLHQGWKTDAGIGGAVGVVLAAMYGLFLTARRSSRRQPEGARGEGMAFLGGVFGWEDEGIEPGGQADLAPALDDTVPLVAEIPAGAPAQLADFAPLRGSLDLQGTVPFVFQDPMDTGDRSEGSSGPVEAFAPWQMPVEHTAPATVPVERRGRHAAPEDPFSWFAPQG